MKRLLSAPKCGRLIRSTAYRGIVIEPNSLKRRGRGRAGAIRRAGSLLKRLVGRPERAHSEAVPPPDAPVAPLAPADAPGDPVIKRGERWLTETFTNFAGARQYRLYIPSAYQGQKLPLIVMLHGCQQWPDDFAAGTQMNALAEENGCFVAYPGQPRSANGLRCWNWFNPRHQHRGRGEPSLIAGITQQIVERYDIDARRVYVAGLSAGGALTAVLAATYPDIYAAVGVHSGLARGAARNVPSAYTAMRRGAGEIAPEVTLAPASLGLKRPVPMIIFHGDQDDTVHPSNAEQVLQQAWPHAGTLFRHNRVQRRVRGGHAYSRTRYIDERSRSVLEFWVVHDSGHAWSGGDPAGSFTDPRGPDASREMIRFFLSHQLKLSKVEETVTQDADS